MNKYLITWNFNKEGVTYVETRRAFYALLNNGFAWTEDPNLESVVFVKTNYSAKDCFDYLGKVLDPNDRICVTKIITGQYTGWLDKSVIVWLES